MCLPLKTHTFIHTLFTAEVSLNTVKNNTFLKKQKLLLCQSNRRDLNILLPHCRHHNGTKSALMPEPNRLVTLSSLGAIITSSHAPRAIYFSCMYVWVESTLPVCKIPDYVLPLNQHVARGKRKLCPLT